MKILDALLDAEGKKVKPSSERTHFYAVTFGFLNLFFCGLVDWYLKQDLTVNTLSLFLLTESSLYFFFSLGYFSTGSEEILSKTDVICLPPGSRFSLVLGANLRHPLTLTLLASASFFWFVHFWGWPYSILVSFALSLLLLLNIAALSSVLFIVFSKSRQPTLSTAVLLLFVLFLVVIGSLVFHLGSLLTSLPFVSWTARGIVDVVQGSFLWLFPLLLNSVVLAVTFVSAKKFL
jgi:hypothetical protein